MPRLHSVAEWANNPHMRNEILRSDAVRRETLKRCYRIPGYTRLSRVEKNVVYDRIRDEVARETVG